jgi:drug/metabolite transporter (DMT)-like permease
VAAILLALSSALAYGLSDFVGGLVARRSSAWAVAVVGAAAATVCTAVFAVFVPGTATGPDLASGALAGIGSGAGAGFLYRGFAAGRMGVVAPVSAVGSAVLPVVVGVLSGERLAILVWVGIFAALPGIWLVSREPATTAADGEVARAAGIVDGLLAGLGFGFLFAALGQVPEEAGLWPLVLTQAVSVPVVAVLAVLVGGSWLPRDRTVLPAVWCGVLSTAATAAFLFATQRGFLTVTSVLTSLYPATTVLLAAVVLHERVHRTQGMGLGLCALAVALVAGG